ncbi:hypothetical protein DRQ15_02020 [candidate division KSB1 bacterium]|nr:MAG: hypothetical protein DRQ11_04600 [candidate division KSB1 bacterium]RKY92543.1 MAG: hypothetical protein DRQ15_02020 [candidate division KSB1 bacterium]
MKKKHKEALSFKSGIRNIVGLSLIIIGIAGLFLPILPGIALIVIGIAVLGRNSKLARALMVFLSKKQKRIRSQN